MYQYVRKEALPSSQIEGTQSSFSDVLLHEIEEVPGVPLDDVAEVSAYVAAIQHGQMRLQEDFPISLRLIREVHHLLLATSRGLDKQPGEFRRSQNWIGGTRPGNALFVPPPVDALDECLGALEVFWHEMDTGLPALIKAGLAHVQFETIHPFLDGNGRVGRFLITLMLCQANLLKTPILYLSLYFKTHRSTYYRLLNEVRESGAWEAWLEFFLQGVIETAISAEASPLQVQQLMVYDRQRIQTVGRGAATALRGYEVLLSHPILTSKKVVEILRVTPTTADTALKNLVNLGILQELTGRQRGRVFAYHRYVAVLSEGTEPL